MSEPVGFCSISPANRARCLGRPPHDRPRSTSQSPRQAQCRCGARFPKCRAGNDLEFRSNTPPSTTFWNESQAESGNSRGKSSNGGPTFVPRAPKRGAGVSPARLPAPANRRVWRNLDESSPSTARFLAPISTIPLGKPVGDNQGEEAEGGRAGDALLRGRLVTKKQNVPFCLCPFLPSDAR